MRGSVTAIADSCWHCRHTTLYFSAMAGYSGTPLPKKLGIQPAHQVVLLDAPKGFAEEILEPHAHVTISRRLPSRSKVDLILLFVLQHEVLKRRFTQCATHIVPTGAIWIAWPKRTSGVATDVSENSVRKVAIAAGLVDNKVCAIDETWSALRCVIRLKDRPPK